jgi:hypothetical protein
VSAYGGGYDEDELGECTFLCFVFVGWKAGRGEEWGWEGKEGRNRTEQDGDEMDGMG